MPRPSRNLDRALLAAGRALLPARGCAGLSVREVTDAAGVNLGMFHYHFKTREVFLRAVLQSMYEEMFAQLTVAAQPPGGGRLDSRASLKAALRFMGLFVRANRPLLARVLADALCGDPIALEFLRENMPRHLRVLQALMATAQAEGVIRAVPPPQALGFCAGSLAMPILFAGAAIDGGLVSKSQARALEAALLSDAALDERIDLALAALGPPDGQAHAATRAGTARKTRRKAP
jgi:AcrR family transcriptional regulator